MDTSDTISTYPARFKLLFISLVLSILTVIGTGFITSIIWYAVSDESREETEFLSIKFIFLYSISSLVAAMLMNRLWRSIVRRRSKRNDPSVDGNIYSTSNKTITLRVYLGYTALIVATSVILHYVNIIFFGLPGLTDWQRKLVESSLQSDSNLLLLFVSTVILAPVWEEIVFRGILFSGLSVVFPDKMVILVTALLWTLSHGYQYNSIILSEILIIGIILGIAVSRTRSVKIPILLHVVNNLIAFINMY